MNGLAHGPRSEVRRDVARYMTLEIVSGPLAGKRISLQPGQLLRVGRKPEAALAIPEDRLLSGLHFVLEYSDGECTVRDLDSANGLFVNGKRVKQSSVKVGDRIVAGETTLTLLSQAGAGPLKFLSSQPEPLFALLDAAHDPNVLPLVRSLPETHQSLYEGEKGEALASVAPYLVALPKGSKSLETIVQKAWGQSWGIFVSTHLPFPDVRNHFRHFLLVKTEDDQQLYFRFYDPRVLRVFLPTCGPHDASQLFGPIRSYLMEGESPDILLKFTWAGTDIKQEVVPLSGPESGQGA